MSRKTSAERQKANCELFPDAQSASELATLYQATERKAFPSALPVWVTPPEADRRKRMADRTLKGFRKVPFTCNPAIRAGT